ncbi:MAG: hypothetical protein PHN82_07245 [bacterium]|nr:hypothetical protein [bacterium]
MTRAILGALICAAAVSAGCAGVTTGRFSRSDRGRVVERIAVVARDQTRADRYQMWMWAKRRPRVVPVDNSSDVIAASLAAKTDRRIIRPELTADALRRLNLENADVLSADNVVALGAAVGADAVLLSDVSFYLQNYLFYKTFGLVEITMRLVSASDGALLWASKGKNFALFITTDSALDKVREKMLVELAAKLEADRALGM